ncbi:hypothetical protein [Oscillatoria salina]|uniref:hypothetical protein n=1 Tax=Oscillatoria salina TaxID=331517 RepID=UPI0013B8F5E8|nr:hypothetical protein [Oscillatoria salina]MBZ8178961.1 hypothetical protein [Oscillatoria salina IIICB1]NET89418.1 hypothetical protein [Kamptonema sp. SIO1D9]
MALAPTLTGVGVIVATALGNVAAGNTANAIDALTAEQDCDRVSLENEHLTKAVGKAIAAVITLAAKQYRGNTQRNLEEIAAHAKDNWVKIFQQEVTKQRYPELREAKLDQFLTPEEYKLTQDGNLTPQEWENIFIRLNMATCKGGGFRLPPEVYLPNKSPDPDDSTFPKPLGDLLHNTFPKALRETLKEDFAEEGQAFAGLTITLLTGTKAELAQLQKNQQEGFQSVFNCIQELENQLKGTVEQQQDAFTQISQQIHSGFAEVCRQLGVVETTITQLLQNLEKTIQNIDGKTDEILAIVLQLSSNSQVSEILKVSQNKLTKISEQLNKTMTYKRIHDSLHHLDFHYKKINPQNFYTIGEEAIETILNNPDLGEMIGIIDKLETECNSLKGDLFWLRKLTEARENILVACKSERSGKLSRSISRIKEVLEQTPTHIHAILKSTVSQLELPEMSQIIKDIYVTYEGDKSQELRIAIDEINHLQQHLNGLIKTHDYWQHIDSEITLFRNKFCYSYDFNLDDLKSEWGDLQDYCGRVKPANEHFQKNNLTEKMNLPINTKKRFQDILFSQPESNLDNIKESLKSYCDSCHRYFDSVDHCLLEFCELKLKPLHRDLKKLIIQLQ